MQRSLIGRMSRAAVRLARVAAALIAGVGFAVAAGGAARGPAGYPSVLLSYESGASPYSGVGRYEGRATCTAFFLDTGPMPIGADAPAYALTAGHCAVLPGPNDVLLDGRGIGRVIFNYFIDGRTSELAVPVAATAYATLKGESVAVLELAASYRELTARLIRPLRVPPAHANGAADSIEIVGAPLWPDLAQAFLRVSRCSVDGTAALVVEHLWHWFDLSFNRCLDVLPGSAGSPVLSPLDRQAIGIVTSTVLDTRPLAACALDHPCEPAVTGARSRPGATYVTGLAAVTGCFDLDRRFSVLTGACPLDAGDQPAVGPSHLGPVNPFLRTQPLGPVRRTWGVTAGGAVQYQFAIVTPPFDCRTTPYGPLMKTAAAPRIDPPLPTAEGFAFLCVAAPAPGDVTGERASPAMVMARIDTTPPRLPAQVTIVDTTGAWRVTGAVLDRLLS